MGHPLNLPWRQVLKNSRLRPRRGDKWVSLSFGKAKFPYKKMYKKLVRYDDWHFADIDPVRLKRMAENLRDQIVQKIRKEDDPYLFYSLTMPLVEAAIRGEIVQSLDEDKLEFISGNFDHDQSEGILPAVYDREFTKAVAGFDVIVQGLSLEQTEKVVRDGITYG